MPCYSCKVVTGLILTSLLLAGGATSQPQVISTVCSETCFTLYKQPSTTWYNAYELCLNTNQRLLLITDATVQNSIEKLQSGDGDGEVWAGGARSLKDNWTDITGQNFQDIYTSEALMDDMCGAYNHELEIIRPVKCVKQANTPLRLSACQTPAINDVCPPGRSLVAGTCMMIPDNYTQTWVQGQQVCTSMGSTLAYTGVTSLDFRQLVSDKVTIINLGLEVWVGVHRNPWVWIAGEGQNIEIPMSYYHWGRNEGGSVQGECVRIKLNDPERLWGDRPCNDQLSYYICENSTQLPTAAPPTLPAESTSGGLSRTAAPPTLPAESTSGGLSQTNIIVIVCVCVGIVLIAAVVAAIILVRKRRDPNNKEPTNHPDTQPGAPQYPVDTYHSYLARVPQTGNSGDLELEPVDLDPYQSAQSVRSTKNLKQTKKSEKEMDGPRYNNVFMME